MDYYGIYIQKSNRIKYLLSTFKNNFRHVSNITSKVLDLASKYDWNICVQVLRNRQ